MSRPSPAPSASHIAYDSFGVGPPILLIHGALTTRSDWPAALTDALCECNQVIAIDRPGHGESRRPRYKSTPHQQASMIRAAIKPSLGEEVVIITHSFGAIVALAYAEQFPDEVARLVLLSPLCFPEFRRVEHPMLAPHATPLIGPMLAAAAWPIVRFAFLPTAHAILFSPQEPPPGWKRRYPFAEIATPGHFVEEGEDANAILPFSTGSTRDWSAIPCPTEILARDADKIVNHALHGRRLARQLPSARYHALPGLGQMLHHFETERIVHAATG